MGMRYNTRPIITNVPTESFLIKQSLTWSNNQLQIRLHSAKSSEGGPSAVWPTHFWGGSSFLAAPQCHSRCAAGGAVKEAEINSMFGCCSLPLRCSRQSCLLAHEQSHLHIVMSHCGPLHDKSVKSHCCTNQQHPVAAADWSECSLKSKWSNPMSFKYTLKRSHDM